MQVQVLGYICLWLIFSVSQTVACERICNDQQMVLGWYHSHPTFTPNPSVRDIETQLKYQVRAGYCNLCHWTAYAIEKHCEWTHLGEFSLAKDWNYFKCISRIYNCINLIYIIDENGLCFCVLQEWFSAGGSHFVGVIVSPYSRDNHRSQSQVQCLTIHQEKDRNNTKSEAHNMKWWPWIFMSYWPWG